MRAPTLTSAELQLRDLREEHVALVARLKEVEATIDSLVATPKKSEQRATMHRLVVFFTAHVGEHARWEEQRLYDVVDRRVGGAVRVTSALRHEHVVMSRWTDELTRLSSSEQVDDVDVRSFVRIAWQLVGVVRAHLEAEDTTILPLL